MLSGVSKGDLEVMNAFRPDVELNSTLNRSVRLSVQIRQLRVDEKCHAKVLDLRDKLLCMLHPGEGLVKLFSQNRLRVPELKAKARLVLRKPYGFRAVRDFTFPVLTFYVFFNC